MRRRSLLGRQTAAPPAGLITDKVAGFIHSWSYARKLRVGYTGNIYEARRSGDNDVENIGFSGNVLNESQLTTFLGGTDGFSSKLYDQSGSRNMVEPSAILAREPLIAASGVINKIDGKPWADFLGSAVNLRTETSAASIMDKDCTVFVVFINPLDTNTGDAVFSEWQSGNAAIYIQADTRTNRTHTIYRPDGTFRNIQFLVKQPPNEKRIYIFRKSGDTIEIYDETNILIRTVSYSATFSGDTFLQIGRAFNAGSLFNGNSVEYLVNENPLNSTDRQTIIDDIKDFYTIS